MSGQSIRNNLTKAAASGVKDAAKACAYLKLLHRETGKSEQYLLSELVVAAVERLPEYAEPIRAGKERLADNPTL